MFSVMPIAGRSCFIPGRVCRLILGESAGDRALTVFLASMGSQAELFAPLAKPGKSKREIIRCRKPYVAREVKRVLLS
jgi:hypothetical protein